MVKRAHSSSRIESHLRAEIRNVTCQLDHTVLPATRHKSTRPALTPTSKQVLDLPSQEGWKAELT